MAARLDGFYHRKQGAVVVRFLAHPLLDNQVIFADRQGRRVAQREAFLLFF
jgi:hypothetical protein